METSGELYSARFRKVLAYIDEHLDEALTVERLSAVAGSSKFHFHRQFTGLFGVTVYQYVKLLRLKRALHELAFGREKRILEIALASGYDSHEAFARAFKKSAGQTPSEFRRAPRWEPWHDAYRTPREMRSRHMSMQHRPNDVKISDFPRTRVGALMHRGDPRRLGDSLRTFITWRRENRLPPSVSATFNIAYDDPNQTPPEQFRMDLCAATDRPITENAYGVVEKVIPAGRCAVLRHVGSDDTLESAIRCLYTEWLPASGEELRDFPLFFQRVRFPPEVPEHESVVDVFLPVI